MTARLATLVILATWWGHTVLDAATNATVAVKAPATRNASLIGRWDVVQARKPPASMQPQFSADTFIQRLELLDGGKLRLTRPANMNLPASEGRWSYVADGHDSGLLHLVYPRWGRSNVTNDYWISVDFENDLTMKMLNFGDEQVILKKQPVKPEGPAGASGSARPRAPRADG